MTVKKTSALAWVCFAAAAAMIFTPSPLLLALVPAHFALSAWALLDTSGAKWERGVTAALLAANWGFLFKVAFMNGAR